MAKSSAAIPRFAEWRASKRLTQLELANASGVGVNTVRRAEYGAKISPIAIDKLAEFFGVTPEDLKTRGPYDK